MSCIVVAGSINMDLIVSVPRLPSRGETLKGHGFMVSPGGKGANQAVAAARLGAMVHFIGATGKDDFGVSLKENLESEGVICRYLYHFDTSTGVALITVSDDGENTIVVSPGANGIVEPEVFKNCEGILKNARVALFQLEMPVRTVYSGLKLAKSLGCTTIFDPAPACELPQDIWRYVDIAVPNEGEIKTFMEHDSIEYGASLLLKRGVETVIVTRGSEGASVFTLRESYSLPAFEVDSVDSVGAGDAFSGALAVAIADGRSLYDSVRFASAAGALACRSLGARSSMASQEEIRTFLKGQDIQDQRGEQN